jgi:molybdenum cofactor synthesis domain-containing protein
MAKKSEITACVIIIGNEILSGRTQENNLSFLGRRLNELGISVVEVRVIQDNEDDILNTLNECRQKYDYIFTTGGIGPTHDDITAATIARAFNVKLIRNQDAVSRLEKHYDSNVINEARLKMANIPEGAQLIDNPISGAPGFRLENVFVMAGVPMIVRVMFEGITDQLIGGDPILSISIATDLSESVLAEDLGKLQDLYPEINIGSYPYFRKNKLGVNIVMRATDNERLTCLSHEVKKLILQFDGEIIREDMPDNI